MNAGNVLDTLLAALATSKTGELVFRKSQVLEWPKGVFDALLKDRVIKAVKPANSLDCDGCESNCFMPVHVLSGQEGKPSRAFISCDKPVNIGRVRVPLEKLLQWKFTGPLFASAVSRVLGMPSAPRPIGEGPVTDWNIGMIRGTGARGELNLHLGPNPCFEIVGHQKPVRELVTLTESGLEVNREELVWFADHPVGSSEARGYKPTKAKRESRKLDTQKRYAEWQRLAKGYHATHPNISDREIAQHISRLPKWKGTNSDTIRRHLKKWVEIFPRH